MEFYFRKRKQSKITDTSRKNESYTNFDAQIQEFRTSYSKMSLEKAELEKKITLVENNLKDYQEKALNYKNEYEKVKEKLSEEIKNRETVLSQVEHSNNIIHSLIKHIQDINNTLKFYEDLNSEDKERYDYLQCNLEKSGKKYESISSGLKMMNENLKSQTFKLEEELQAETSAYGVSRRNIELVKYSLLELKFQDTKTELENLQKDNAELKSYRVKCNELEAHVQKLQQEKEAMSNILESSQQDLSKSETEKSEQKITLEDLYFEREKMNENISQLEGEFEDLALKLKEKTNCLELLFIEMQKLVEKYKVLCENLENYKVEHLRLEEEIRKACDGSKIRKYNSGDKSADECCTERIG